MNRTPMCMGAGIIFAQEIRNGKSPFHDPVETPVTHLLFSRDGKRAKFHGYLAVGVIAVAQRNTAAGWTSTLRGEEAKLGSAHLEGYTAIEVNCPVTGGARMGGAKGHLAIIVDDGNPFGATVKAVDQPTIDRWQAAADKAVEAIGVAENAVHAAYLANQWVNFPTTLKKLSA